MGSGLTPFILWNDLIKGRSDTTTRYARVNRKGYAYAGDRKDLDLIE
jgi:hypothetical protein